MVVEVPQSKTFKSELVQGCKNSSLFDIGKNMENTTDKSSNVIEGVTGGENQFLQNF